jgi:signal peptidase I
MNNKGQEWVARFYRSWIFSLLIAALIATSFKSAIADWYIVPTGSMKPTILEGDRIFVNKLAYDLKVPCTTIHLATWDNSKRGDTVIFTSPADGKGLVKRVIGTPRDSVALVDDRLFINGRPIHYDQLSTQLMQGLPNEVRTGHELYREDLAGREHPVMITPSVPAMRTFGLWWCREAIFCHG